jgi:signal transduction histidine kinase/DNA-binding NarL/FixJ family response regulator
VNPVAGKRLISRNPEDTVAVLWHVGLRQWHTLAQVCQGVAAISQLDDKIYHEQIRLIYNQGPVLVLGAMFCAILLTAFLWTHLPQSMLLVWLAAVCFSAALRLLVIRSYQNASNESKNHSHWGPFFWVGTLSAGMIWGAWPLMFYEIYNTEFLLLISTIFAGMVAVSAASGSVYLPSFNSFSTPLILPLSVTHMLSGIDSLVLTGVLLLIFLGVNGFLASRGNRHYVELIRARFENHELMERLEQEKVIAERAVIAKSRFLAAASHDLRQPLHAMGLFMSALRNHESDPRQLRIIDDMAKSAESLNGLFNSLLDVSRLDAEIIEFNPVHVDISDLFDRLRAQFDHQVKKKRLQLSVESSQCVLYTDIILLERVLRNLLSNAIQYTEHGVVTMRCRDGGAGEVSITLGDTGIGIPASEQDDVFSEYHQLNNPERDRSKGLGLGLAIVKRLCDLMNIPLHMESAVGQGTLFEMRLPAGDVTMVKRPVPVEAPVNTTGRRVLVIEDEQLVLHSMQHMLEGWGCEVLLAESARDALKVIALSGLAPEVIFSDYRLRNNNGVDAVVAVRESLNENIPAVIITGDTSPERLREVTASHFLLMHKPVSPEELRQMLNRLLPARNSTGAAPALKEPSDDSLMDTSRQAGVAATPQLLQGI